MKKIIIGSILMLLTGFLFAETDFSGTAAVTINANIPEADGFSSTLNPGNMLGITDIGMSPGLAVKMNAGDDRTTFSAWISLKEYPLGQGLLAACGSSQSVAAFLAAAGDTFYTLDLQRLSANVYLADNLALEVGRQSMLTGYGYGWNPIDFADPLKDPQNPEADKTGVDAVALKTYFGSILSLKLYTLFPRNFLASGLDYKDVKPGGELTVSLPGVECKLAGIWDFVSAGTNDAYTPALGGALNVDIFGIGVYGEASMRKGSRNYFANSVTGAPSRKTSWLFSTLAGLQYTLPSEGNVVFEYFYNGEGYDREERMDYKKSISLYPPTGVLLAMYTPGFFARQYILLNVTQPFYAANAALSLSLIYSPDSGACMVSPSVTYTFSGSFEGTVLYTGMFDTATDDFSEVTALPVHHVIKAVFTYSF